MSLGRARELLGLDPSFSADDVETRFRTVAQRLHPDAGGDADGFRLLVEARRRARASSNTEPTTVSRTVGSARRTPVVVINTDGWLERQWKALLARVAKRPPRDLE